MSYETHRQPIPVRGTDHAMAAASLAFVSPQTTEPLPPHPWECHAQWASVWVSCLWVAEICERELYKPPVPNKGPTWATFELTNIMASPEPVVV